MSLRGKAGVFAGPALLRLLLTLAFPRLPNFLTRRVEISTPITSFKRLQEGLFLWNHNVNPYDGGVYHQAPLFLPLFSLLPNYRTSPIYSTILFIIMDLLCADAIAKIADSREGSQSRLFASPRRARHASGVFAAAAFLFNPFTIATCIGRSTSVFTNCAILHAIVRAIRGSPFHAMVALSFATYLSMYPILLLPPLILLAFDRQAEQRRNNSAIKFSARCVLITAGCIGFLLGMSYLLMDNSWLFLERTYGIQLTLSDLKPNVGLWWYFFIEIFDSFRAFFLAVFWLHLSSYVGGVTIRMRTQPMAALTVMLGIFAIFKPYPAITDTSLFLAMLPMYRHVFPLMRYTFVATAVILYATCLGPAFYHLWIYAGSGNANFFYAVTLVWSLGQSLLLSDLTFAILRDEWELERPEMVGKDVKQI